MALTDAAPGQRRDIAPVPGSDFDAPADLVMLDEALQVVATLVGGEVVYLRDPARLTYS